MCIYRTTLLVHFFIHGSTSSNNETKNGESPSSTTDSLIADFFILFDTFFDDDFD